MCNQCDEKDERIRQLETELFGKTWQAPTQLALSAVQERVLATLIKHPRTLSAEALFEASRGANTHAEVLSGHLISVIIMQLRRKLLPHGIQIDNVRARGYRLSDAARALLLNWPAQRAAA